jgi:hypothetical protein
LVFICQRVIRRVKASPVRTKNVECSRGGVMAVETRKGIAGKVCSSCEQWKPLEGFYGSGRESVKTFDLRGFSSCVQFDRRSRRRCGNGGTRVLCWFPSSEGGQNRCGRRSVIPPSAPFPQRGPDFLAILARTCCLGAGGAKTGAGHAEPFFVLTPAKSNPF